MILGTPRQELFLYHHGLGRKIRNYYGLWQADQSLLAEIREDHPDNASGVIIGKFWDKLRKTEAEALGFKEYVCVNYGEKEADGSGETWCDDCARFDQAYEPWMTGGE